VFIAVVFVVIAVDIFNAARVSLLRAFESGKSKILSNSKP